MIPYTDVHIHLLYDMDDGPKAREDMVEMLKAAARDGAARIVVTPHVTPGVSPFDEEKYARRLEEAREIGRAMTPPVEVFGGAEILYSAETCAMLREGRVPTMAGTDIVLVEFSPNVKFEKLCRSLKDLSESGFMPMLAHVERYQCLAKWPMQAKWLKEQPVLYQVNANTFMRKMGLRGRWFLRTLAKNHLMDAIGTDAHNCSSRPTCMEKAYPAILKLCGERYAQTLLDGSVLFDAGAHGHGGAE